MEPELHFREKQFFRIDSFAELKDGWLWGEGKAVSESVRKRAKRFLIEASFLPEPYATAPTEDGGILIEFESARWDVSIELLPDGSALLYGYQLSGAEEFDFSFGPNRWEQLLNQVKEKTEDTRTCGHDIEKEQ